MKSYTTLINDYKTLTQNSTTENETLGAQLINDSIRTVASMRGGRWPWLEIVVNVDTTASQEHVIIPADVEKIADLYVTVGTNPNTNVVYTPIAVFDAQRWKYIIASRLGTSDWALYYYVQYNRVLIQPRPATTGNVVTFRARKKIRDLGIADYTTGGILTATLDSTTLVGTGTTWTASMAGRWIRITASDTANKGDGQWYQISSVTDATTLELVAPYQGTSIVAGNAAYTIGQMSVIPEPYDTAPLYRAAALYWQTRDSSKYEQYMKQYDGGYEAGFQQEGPGGIVGQLIETFGETTEGAYIPVDSAGANGPWKGPPYWLPYQDASGF